MQIWNKTLAPRGLGILGWMTKISNDVPDSGLGILIVGTKALTASREWRLFLIHLMGCLLYVCHPSIGTSLVTLPIHSNSKKKCSTSHFGMKCQCVEENFAIQTYVSFCKALFLKQSTKYAHTFVQHS